MECYFAPTHRSQGECRYSEGFREGFREGFPEGSPVGSPEGFSEGFPEGVLASEASRPGKF